jgi:hypothetical protein
LTHRTEGASAQQAAVVRICQINIAIKKSNDYVVARRPSSRRVLFFPLGGASGGDGQLGDGAPVIHSPIIIIIIIIITTNIAIFRFRSDRGGGRRRCGIS